MTWGQCRVPWHSTSLRPQWHKAYAQRQRDTCFQAHVCSACKHKSVHIFAHTCESCHLLCVLVTYYLRDKASFSPLCLFLSFSWVICSQTLLLFWMELLDLKIPTIYQQLCFIHPFSLIPLRPFLISSENQQIVSFLEWWESLKPFTKASKNPWVNICDTAAARFCISNGNCDGGW